MSFANLMSVQRVFVLINLALITLGAYLAVSLFYKVAALQVPESTPTVSVPDRAAARAPGVVQPLAYYDAILQRDLFRTSKTAQPETPATAVDVDELEQTQLQLKLWGTVSGDTTHSYAVIEDTQKREQNLYRVGDTLQNATIKMILREKVVLGVEDRDEVLAMEDPGTGAAAPAAAVRGQPVTMTMTPVPAMDQRISLQRAMIEDALQDVNRLMTEVAITPHMEDGRAEGLALNNIKPNSIFRRMGLRNGDILTGVNGQPILTVDDAMQLYTNLRSASEVQVQIKRRGQERNITYNLR